MVTCQSLGGVETAYRSQQQTRKGAREAEDICSNTTSLISVTGWCAERLGSVHVDPVGNRDMAELPQRWECGKEGYGRKMGFMLSGIAVASLGDRQLLLRLETFLFP